jgi:hypothetical protein
VLQGPIFNGALKGFGAMTLNGEVTGDRATLMIGMEPPVSK